jgi:DNA-binding transcriptional ArsR family regulator
MRPLHHAALKDITVEGILHALSDPTRARIYATLAGCGEPQTCSSFMTSGGKRLPKSTLSQHFKVLRESGLIRSERHGVELRSTSRCEEINQRFPGLLASIRDALAVQHKGHAGTSRTRSRRNAGRR